MWVDASSLATGILLEVAGDVVEDASWLHHKSDAGHINLTELDAVLRGVYLAIAWKLNDIEIKSYSRTVGHWVTDILTGQSKVKSSSANEMLIRRRLGTLHNLVEEFALIVKTPLPAQKRI